MNFEFESICPKLDVDQTKVSEYKDVIGKFLDHVFKFDSKFNAECAADENEPKDSLSRDVFERWTRFEEDNMSEIKKEACDRYKARPNFEYSL